MDSDIVKRMRLEEADLSRKLKAVRDLLAAYGEVGDDGAVSSAPVRKATSGSREKVGIEGFGEYGRRVVAEAMRVMLTSNHPVKTRAIVETLDAMSVEISGENKINALGALLARSSDIVSHGKVGWSVAGRERALEIVSKYAHKENEAPSGEPPEPQKPAGWGVPPPSPAPSNPNQWPHA